MTHSEIKLDVVLRAQISYGDRTCLLPRDDDGDDDLEVAVRYREDDGCILVDAAGGLELTDDLREFFMLCIQDKFNEDGRGVERTGPDGRGLDGT